MYKLNKTFLKKKNLLQLPSDKEHFFFTDKMINYIHNIFYNSSETVTYKKFPFPNTYSFHQYENLKNRSSFSKNTVRMGET